MIAGQVVVDRDYVHALATKRVEIAGHGSNQGFTFTGFHFGDIAVVEGDTPHYLHVIGLLFEDAPGGLAHGSEGVNQDFILAGPVCQCLFKLGSFGF